MHVPLRTRSAVAAMNPWIDLKCLTSNLTGAHARRETLTSQPQGNGKNLCRNFVDSVSMDKFEDDRGPKDQLEDEAPPSAKTLPL